MEKTKNPLDEVQPVDDYVLGLLRHASENQGVNIDLENPTRGQRLEAALALQNEDNGWSSMEIMVGRRLESSGLDAQTYGFLTIMQAMSPQPPKRFYEGFAHAYWPEKDKK